jgi:hypothetical protein
MAAAKKRCRGQKRCHNRAAWPVHSKNRSLLLLKAEDNGIIRLTNSKVTSMTDNSALTIGEESRPGVLNYLENSAQSSLYRNGKILTRRDADGSDAGWEGVVRENLEMGIHDGRRLNGAKRCTAKRNGFELLTRPTPGQIDFLDQNQVVNNYYGHCAEIVQEATGARAFAFDHNIRSASGKKSQTRIEGGQQVQGPARMVHGDYTLTSGPQRLRDLAKPATGNDTLRSILGAGQSLIDQETVDKALGEGGRFAIINVWRNIAKEPVATYPMALCDGQTVRPADLVVFEIHYQDRIGENYFAKYSPHHRWVCYPGMTGDEALLIKQWDSDGKMARTKGAEADSSEPQSPCTFSFHTAFDDLSAPPDAPDRWSIEVRCIVVYD